MISFTGYKNKIFFSFICNDKYFGFIAVISAEQLVGVLKPSRYEKPVSNSITDHFINK